MDDVLNPARQGPWPSFSPHAPLILQMYTCTPGGKSLNLYYHLYLSWPLEGHVSSEDLNSLEKVTGSGSRPGGKTTDSKEVSELPCGQRVGPETASCDKRVCM